MTDEHRSVALPFDEELLSGFLDGALTQQDAQKVRVHLEDSPEARRLLDELRAMREASMTTRFQEHEDRQWQEVGRTATSRGARMLGLGLLLVWVIGASGFALWQVAEGTDGWLERTLVFGGVGGAVLVLVSVFLDRVRDSRTDRYRGVEK